jgi:hypothetical protein
MKENLSACLARHTSNVKRHTSSITTPNHNSKKEHTGTFILAETLAVPAGVGIEFAQTEQPNEKWNTKL